MIISIIAFILLAITIVLLPLALVLGGLVLISLLLANLFVASSLGRIIFGYMKWSGKEWQLYTLGFLALCILLHYPDHQYPYVCNQLQPWIWGNSYAVHGRYFGRIRLSIRCPYHLGHGTVGAGFLRVGERTKITS